MGLCGSWMFLLCVVAGALPLDGLLHSGQLKKKKQEYQELGGIGHAKIKSVKMATLQKFLD